ncbi:MAG: diacylglycerol kinase family lipid kinase [Clostridia bacterium]|nr:diacylglycerol kinase family lipid kinase [Clostridia bacterium]
MKHIICINPVAGKGKNEKFGIRIQKILKKYGIDSEIIVSKYSGHITELTKEYSKKQTCRFYSVGGDGTLNEIVSGIIGSESDIVIVPCGTGNDFIKSTSKYMSMRKIILNSIGKTSQKVDVLKINNLNKYCINILSCGFDSMVAKNVDKFRKIPFISGKVKYNLSIIYTLFSNRNFRFKMRVKHKGDTKVIKQNYTLVAVSNGKYYGGGIFPCPDAKVSDGIINICFIDSTTIFKKLILLPYYKKGTHTKLKQAHFLETENLSIVSSKEFPANVDGEVFYTNKLSISIIPSAVNIVYIN